MKKLFVILILALIATACATEAAQNEAAQNEDLLVISDQYFVSKFHQILFNPDEYIGTVVKYEGIFGTFPFESAEGERHIYMIYRYIMGCCGPEGHVGFELRLDGLDGLDGPDVLRPLPDDTWAEVVGVIEDFDYNGTRFLRLEVLSIAEMDERGQEFVSW